MKHGSFNAYTHLKCRCDECRLAHNAYIRARYLRDPERIYRQNIFRKYGVTQTWYEECLKRQKGRCAICRGKKIGGVKKKFCIDHDHKTKQVRGLLCTRCNSALGWFEAHSDGVMDYLMNHWRSMKEKR